MADGWQERIDHWQQSRPALSLFVGIGKKFADDRAGRLAAVVSFFGFFSLFPLLLVFVATLGFVLDGNPELRRDIVDTALGQFPLLADELASDNTADPEEGTLSGSPVAVAVGLAAAVWAGLRATDALEGGLNDVYDVPRDSRSNFFVRRLRGLAVLAVLAVGLSISGFLAGVATALPLGWLTRFVPSALALVVNSALVTLITRILVNCHLEVRRLLPGAVAAGAAFVILQLIGSVYVTRTIDGASDVYGTFAFVIGLLSWIYLQARVLLASAELNVVLSQRLWPRSLFGPPRTRADLEVAQRLRQAAAERSEAPPVQSTPAERVA